MSVCQTLAEKRGRKGKAGEGRGEKGKGGEGTDPPFGNSWIRCYHLETNECN